MTSKTTTKTTSAPAHPAAPQNQSRTPTAASGTRARVIRIRKSRSPTPKAASSTDPYDDCSFAASVAQDRCPTRRKVNLRFRD